MNLNSKDALTLLNKKRTFTNSDRWIDHCVCVGNTAGRLASSLNLDEDFAKTLGYIHDIGKSFENESNTSHDVFSHAILGYDYLKSLGYAEKYAGICIKHSFLNNDIDCLANNSDKTDRSNPNYDFVKSYIRNEYTLYEKIINLCDLMCTQKVYTLDKRMIDLLLRHGVFAKTRYHIEQAVKLKDYFDSLLGYNLYNLFPEIKENL